MSAKQVRLSLRAFLMVTTNVSLATAVHAQTTTPQLTQANASQLTGDVAAAQPTDIVITALRRSTNIQSTPLAVTAVTGATLSAEGVTDSSQLAKVSPGLVITESPLSGSRLTLRNIRAAGEATVGLYYDDTPVPGSSGVNADSGGTTPSIRLFDVDRVEVLRGPQGTLYGSSSEAGTVRLIFAKPNLQSYDAAVSGEISSVDHGNAPGGQTQAMVNVPLVNDKLGVRIVGFYQDSPGYIDNVNLGMKGINKQESEGGRVTLRAQPIDTLTVDLLAVSQFTRGALDDYSVATGPYKQNYSSLQPMTDKFQLYSAKGAWDLGPVTLTAVVSHSRRDFIYSYDSSAFFQTEAALYPAGSATNAAFAAQAPSVANSPQLTTTDTAEFRISSNTHGALQYTAGVFYSDRDGNFDSNILLSDAATGKPLPIDPATLQAQRAITDKLKQLAGYAEGTYDFTTKLSFTFGLRYFEYDRDATSTVTVVDNYAGFSASPTIGGHVHDSGFLYKADLSYKFTPLIMGYVTASSGERPGGVNTTLGLPSGLQTYKSDSLWNYEAGVKSQWLDRMLTVNADVYEIDWSNLQTTGALIGSNFSFIANAGAARIYGTELEATLRPMAGLQLQASTAYSHATLSEDQTDQTLQASGKKGDDIPYVPDMTAQANAEYSWDLTNNLRATVRADIYYSGFSWTTFPHTNAFQDRLPAYTTEGVRATIAGPGGWTVSLFANNILNSDAITNKLTSAIYGGLNKVRAISLTPRTVGINFTKHF